MKMADWKRRIRLTFNAQKTQFIWFGSRQQLAKIPITEIVMDMTSIPVTTHVRNLVHAFVTVGLITARVCCSGPGSFGYVVCSPSNMLLPASSRILLDETI